jgi:hypothetical protein
MIHLSPVYTLDEGVKSTVLYLVTYYLLQFITVFTTARKWMDLEPVESSPFFMIHFNIYPLICSLWFSDYNFVSTDHTPHELQRVTPIS